MDTRRSLNQKLRELGQTLTQGASSLGKKVLADSLHSGSHKWNFSSKKTSTKKRRAFDQYNSPAVATMELLAKYPFIGGDIFEPCCGDGQMAEILSSAGKVKTNDIDPKIKADFHMNAVQPEVYGKVGTDWVISNPPYSQALLVVQEAYSAAKIGCAFLLRLSFLEPTIARGIWLKEHPPTNIIVMPRISFTGDNKTDSVTVAWLIWDKSQVKKHPPFQFTLRSEMKR